MSCWCYSEDSPGKWHIFRNDRWKSVWSGWKSCRLLSQEVAYDVISCYLQISIGHRVAGFEDELNTLWRSELLGEWLVCRCTALDSFLYALTPCGDSRRLCSFSVHSNSRGPLCHWKASKREDRHYQSRSETTASSVWLSVHGRTITKDAHGTTSHPTAASLSMNST